MVSFRYPSLYSFLELIFVVLIVHIPTVTDIQPAMQYRKKMC
jgi:hypothetical protein